MAFAVQVYLLWSKSIIGKYREVLGSTRGLGKKIKLNRFSGKILSKSMQQFTMVPTTKLQKHFLT